MVQRLKGDHKTFAEIADVLMSMILREGATSKRIDVVFDVYRETSIKNTEREREERGIHGNRVQKYTARSQNTTMEEVLIEPSEQEAVG